MNGFLPLESLQGNHVRLEPLAREHVEGLRKAATDGELWKLWYTSVPTPEAVPEYIDQALAMRAEGMAMPYAVRSMASDEVVGSTRFCHADAANRHLEIGYTWYARSMQRSPVNTEAKWLLLHQAFERLDCVRVQFCTHWLNHRSRAAIERLGAHQEGVLRNHRILADGSCRDTVVFSIIASEWPAVKRHLAFKLEWNDKQ